MADDYSPEAEKAEGNDTDALLLKLKGWFKQDIVHATAWRKEAREDYRFYNGDQWDENDKIQLRNQMRPVITFNRVAPLVNAVIGSEINNRREVRYIPREQGDALANEVLTAAAEWFRDECGAEDEESTGFKDCTIGGMGWTDTRLDFEDQPDGAPEIERMDPMEMVWDCNSVKENLADAGRMYRVREISYEAAAELTGEKDRSKLHAAWAKGIVQDGEVKDQTEENLYQENTGDEENSGYEGKKCCVVEARWFERETYYRGMDIANPTQMREYADAQVQLIQKNIPNFRVVRQQRKVLRRAFIGSVILGAPDKPMVPAGYFGWECITGFKDEGKNQFYGIVRAAKDPQRWANKFLSQVMFLMNSQSKGGIMAEKGAFESERQAEESWAKTDAITWMKKGALQGANPMVLPKPAAQFPQGFFALYETSQESISQVTGLSPEFIGTREVDQAGVLEYQRRQSSLSLLAPLFNSLRRYRKRQGRVMLYLIQNHLADGRLVRIVGDDMKQYVPLTKEAVASAEYDIIVDDSPSSPNEKDRTWQILMQLMPMIKDMITPEIGLELLAISPLPASLVEKLKQKAQQAAAQPKPPTPGEQKMQLEQQKGQIAIAGKAADVQAKQQSAQIDQQSQVADLMMQQQKNQMDLEVAHEKNDIAMQQLAIKQRANEIAAQKADTQRTTATH